ncbi:hypothetical protein [Actinomadura sp. WMMA1423]|uniref:hypothetical protein n=1 Tax=Actinomadura sp. WMMA1423 TaxID=2591108 RepID=UPI001146F4FF|nr:hypothetical protein [Actinomadura sp. WMMA1423]
MSASVHFVSSEAIDPADVHELVVSMDGGRDPVRHVPGEAVLARDGACVNVSTRSVGEEERERAHAAAWERALGAPPRTLVTMELVGRDHAQWLAAEIVLAAAERWRLVVEDLAEETVTVPEFERRLARRQGGFFLPDRWLDPSPAAQRRHRTKDAALLLPGGVTAERFLGLVRSLGAEPAPDDRTDAVLSRGAARVWVRAQPPGFAGVPPQDVLGAPPYNAVIVEVFEAAGSQLLAAELVEAAAAHWPLLVRGFSGQVLSVDDVRARVATGTQDVFDP